MSGPALNPSAVIDEGVISAQVKLSAPSGEVQALGTDEGVQFIREDFSGAIYRNTITLTDDDETRFETSEKILLDVIILPQLYDANFGDVTTQDFPRAKDLIFGFTKVDISTLYFKNKAAGQNTKVSIMGTEL